MKRTPAGLGTLLLLLMMMAACGEQDSSRTADPTAGRVATDAGDGMAADSSSAANNADSASNSASTCPSALPLSLQAEDADRTSAEIASDTAGFHGSGYVAEFDQVGARVAFDVCVPAAGYYTLDFRYAKGTDGVATRTLKIDGQAYAAAPRFDPLGDWARWSTGGHISLRLEPGPHQLALEYQASDSGQLRLDALNVSSGPSPSEISVRSLFMNDWQDLVVGWHAAELYPSDMSSFGPRMTALHTGADWPTNQLDEAQAFLRDDGNSKAYSDPHQLQTRAQLVASDGLGYGELRVEYGPYGRQPLPVNWVRRQIVPPEQGVVVVLYELSNSAAEARDLSLLEWADLHNASSGPSEDAGDTGSSSEARGTLQAEWHSELNAWIIDMRDTNGTVLVVGGFQPAAHHVAGEPVSGGPDQGAPTVQQFFSDPSALADSGSFTGSDAGVGLHQTVHLEPGGSTQLAFFYGVAESIDAATALAQHMRDSSAGALAQASSSRWKQWLDSGKLNGLPASVAARRDALATALVTIRQSQQPQFGSFVASTNPAYYYSVWPRDASVTALSLDAAGYLDAAEKYWTWMAQAQADGSNTEYPKGTWWTNYGFWSPQRGIDFVHPEWDSLGLFLVGVYQHQRALAAQDDRRAAQFVEKLWPAVKNTANFIQQGANDPDNHGFGPKDYSIWEEDLAFQTFTQTTYVAGLRAAELLARQRGDGAADGWGAAADSIRDAILRPASATPCAGLWSDDNYFVRSVKPDCTPDRRVDAATDLLWVLGVVQASDPRATQHRDAILFNLTPGDFGDGISRYEGDTFYYSADFSPGGPYEALQPMPVWPQMTMYMAMLEHWLQLDQPASDRLSWYVATTPWGGVPQGEAVDWSTQRPLVSTAAEPVTGAWFVLALLNQLDAFDPRLPPHDSWGAKESQ